MPSSIAGIFSRMLNFFACLFSQVAYMSAEAEKEFSFSISLWWL